MSVYTRDDIRVALKAAGLPSYVRHEVYNSLPAKQGRRKYRTVIAGGAYDNVYLTDLDGNVHQGAMVVAACSLQPGAQQAKHITFWLPAGIAADDSIQGLGKAVTAKYDNVEINHCIVEGVK